jgi:hypothetical protein
MILEQFGANTVVAMSIAATADGISGNHFFNAIRSIGALLVATLVPLLIDRRFRR